MNNTHLKKKIIVSVLAGAIMIPGSVMTARAAEEEETAVSPLPITGIESVLANCYESNVKSNLNLYLVPTNEGEYLNRAFSNISDFIYIRSAPDENSDWTGKLYAGNTVNVLEYVGDWAKIQSGNASGYIPSEMLYTGEQARERAADYEKKQITVTADVLNVRKGQNTDTPVLTQVYAGETYLIQGEPIQGWYPIQAGGINGWVCGDYVTVQTSYSYAESREEEEQRLAAEAAAQARRSMGQEVIDYACQFIGNPYVWGGTSLTNGADCSGFVQSVYAEFGVSLPRTTWDMEQSGYAVSYDEMMPGDLVLYDGHVGLYMGDGNIVNAMNEADGIGVCNVDYAPIIAIRRVL